MSKLKKLQWLLRNGSLKSREIILWHDVINNSITKHPKNFNTKCSPEQLTEIITNFQHQIAAIIHIRRDGTPHIFEKLRKTKPLIINAIKRLLPKQKQNDIDTGVALSKLHPPPSLYCAQQSTFETSQPSFTSTSAKIKIQSTAHQVKESSNKEKTSSPILVALVLVSLIFLRLVSPEVFIPWSISPRE